MQCTREYLTYIKSKRRREMVCVFSTWAGCACDVAGPTSPAYSCKPKTVSLKHNCRCRDLIDDAAHAVFFVVLENTLL